jgi:lysophospholipase L1-like esterase
MRARRAIAVASSLIAISLVGVLPASAGAAQRPITRPAVVPGSRYLAIGDSVTFGYREPATVPAPNYNNPSSFIGYPQIVAAALHLRVTNAACPGETSSSMINTFAPSNGCTNSTPPTSPAFRSLFPLHVSYKGSQLSFAIRFLRRTRNVRLVTLEIGANDLFLCQKTQHGCTTAAALQGTVNTVQSNIRRILSAIRQKARYRGQIVIVNYYSLDYNNAFITNAVNALNRAQDTAGRPFRVLIANGYGQFYQGSLHSGANPCTAGLLTQLGAPGKCGVHPSYGGQSLLALAVQRAVHL